MLKRYMLASVVAVSLVAATSAFAGERGLTNYLAGYYGDFAVAVQPSEGIYAYATAYAYSAILEGPQGSTNLDLQGTLAITGFQYVTPWRVFGAKYAVAGYTTYLQGRLTPDGTSSASDDGLGDSSVSPLVLYWKAGPNVHISVYESIILPTGSFEPTRAVNTSRNYFSFDSVLALTWLNPQLGVEFSIVPGLMINTTNESTDYRSGAELHVDGMANFFINANFALGLHGYYYQQIDDDEFAALKIELPARSAGIGPAILLVPVAGKGKIVGKWLHEFEAQNRFQGDIFSLTAVLKF